MTNFKEALKEIEAKVFGTTKKMRIVQKEQTQLKNDLTHALMMDLEDADIEVYPVQKGFVILVPNDEEGAIPVELNIITKPLDYDYLSHHQEYIDKQKED